LLHKLKLENFYNAILFTNGSYDFFSKLCYLKKKKTFADYKYNFSLLSFYYTN